MCRRLCRARTRQAPDRSKRKNRRTTDPTDAKEDRRRRLRNTLPIAKASGGTGVRTDQTGTRLPPVPVAGRRESACRMGHDLHHPQPPEAVHPRNGRLSRPPCNKCPSQRLSGRAPSTGETTVKQYVRRQPSNERLDQSQIERKQKASDGREHH